MHLAVVGSRTIYENDEDRGMFLIGLRMLEVLGILDFHDIPKTVTHLVSGLAPGADEFAIDLSLKHQISYTGYVAEWETLGKAAGSIRNGYIVEQCDVALVLWDGQSRGTRDTLSKLWVARKPHVVVIDDGDCATVDIQFKSKFVRLHNAEKRIQAAKLARESGGDNSHTRTRARSTEADKVGNKKRTSVRPESGRGNGRRGTGKTPVKR